MLHKSFSFEVKEATDEGRIAGYASTFDNIDDQGDVVRRGAFLDTIAVQRGQVPMLWQHRTNEPIGKTTLLAENDRGLVIEGQLLLKIQKAQEAFALIKEGIVKGFSIGYEPTKWAWRKGTDNVRELSAIRLYEVSPVTFPANEEAQILSSKECTDIRRVEGILREAGFSRGQAKALLAKGFDGLREGDACEAVPDEVVELVNQLQFEIDLERLTYGLR